MEKIQLDELIKKIVEKNEELARMVYVQDGNIVVNVHYEYNIALSRCDTHEKILGWCIHLCEKTWMTPEVLRRFAELAIQQNALQAPTAP